MRAKRASLFSTEIRSQSTERGRLRMRASVVKIACKWKWQCLHCDKYSEDSMRAAESAVHTLFINTVMRGLLISRHWKSSLLIVMDQFVVWFGPFCIVSCVICGGGGGRQKADPNFGKITVKNVLWTVPAGSPQFSSVQGRINVLRETHAPQTVSRMFPQRCLWNSSANVHPSELRMALSSRSPLVEENGSSSVSSFHASLLQVISGVMSLVLCPQVVSQAPQHFRSCETQAACDGCLVYKPFMI